MKCRRTHELSGSDAVDRRAVDGRDLVGESEVDEFDVEPTSTLHDDVVRRDAQVHDAAMMQKLHRVQHLAHAAARQRRHYRRPTEQGRQATKLTLELRNSCKNIKRQKTEFVFFLYTK